MATKTVKKKKKIVKIPKRAKVILLNKISNLGEAGEIKMVKPGYARNYLLPRKLAELAHKSAIKSLEKRKESILKLSDKKREEALLLQEKIKNLRLEFNLQSSIAGTPYGSIGKKDIIETLKENDIIIGKNQVHLFAPIKGFGNYKILIQLMPEVSAELKLMIKQK